MYEDYKLPQASSAQLSIKASSHLARESAPFAKACEKVPRKERPLAAGANIQQCIWKPTKRRVRADPLIGRPSYKEMPPVLGPVVPDSTKKASPAYTFGQRRSQSLRVADDGPAKFDISGLCNRGTYRKKGIAFKSRLPEITSRTKVPGVGTYKVEQAYRAAHKDIPRYTFGKRQPPVKPFITPAPNVYNLPPVVGTAKEGNKKSPPAYSLMGRPKVRPLKRVPPGPGEYEDKTAIRSKRPPKYTMRCLHKIYDDNLNKPGPGAYCPERIVTHRSVPAPSFSIHHSPYVGLRKFHIIKDCQQPVKGDDLIKGMLSQNMEKC